MRILLAAALLAFLIPGCKKNGSSNDAGSFPGALDSIVFYNTVDSANYTRPDNIHSYLYDDQHRVVQIKLGQYQYRLFQYQGGNPLPLLQIDSFASSTPSQYNYRYSLLYHRLTYDNLNRVTADTITSFQRVRYNSTYPEGIENQYGYRYTYTYQSDFMRFRDSRNTLYQYFYDTSFFNAAGDIKRLKEISSNGTYEQYVTDYYTEKNPLTELNIAPLYNTQYQINIWASMQNLSFNLFHPTYMYKKMSGKNATYYINSKDDLTEVNFYFDKDASGRISHLVLIKYIHYYSSAGVNFKTDREVANFRFFYH